MATVTVSLPADGSTGTVSQYNTPLTTVVNEFNGNIDNANIKSSAAIATSKLATDNGIGATHLSTSAITLGYAQITANISTNSTPVVQATGLTSTVTIPAGGRKVKVTAYIPYVQLTAGGYAFITLWDGVVGSGTQLQQWQAKLGDLSVTQGVQLTFVHTPSAGSKTYNIGYTTGSGTTVTINAGSTNPAFILVEAI
jgi:hypothetical protein